MSKPRTHEKRGSTVTSSTAIGVRDAATPPGDALAPGKADPADLRPVEAVRRGEGQPRPVAIGEVERADLDAHRGRRPVDDRAHELVPVAGERRELGDVVEERELVEATTAAGSRGCAGAP